LLEGIFLVSSFFSLGVFEPKKSCFSFPAEY